MQYICLSCGEGLAIWSDAEQGYTCDTCGEFHLDGYIQDIYNDLEYEEDDLAENEFWFN